MKNTLFFLFLISFIYACDPSTPDTPVVDNPTDPKPQETVDEWLCIPNVQVGKITPKSTEEDLIKAYGKARVIRKQVGAGEGEMIDATIILPGSKDELIIEWQEDFLYQRPSRIRIEKEGSQWHTSEDIRIGTTLDQLLAINGKDFNFYGFDWDYGGLANDWDGGKINKQLVVSLNPENPEAVYPDLLGEEIYSTTLEKAREAKLKVSSMIIHFGL